MRNFANNKASSLLNVSTVCLANLEEIVEELKGCIFDRVSTEVGRGRWVGLGEVEDFDPQRRVVNEDEND